MQPVLDKIDLPHLCRDIQKCNDAGVLNAESYRWWEEFLKTFEDVYGTVTTDTPPWPLDALRLAAKPSSVIREVSVPTVIQNLHQSEKESPREVITIVKYNLKYIFMMVLYHVVFQAYD